MNIKGTNNQRSYKGTFLSSVNPNNILGQKFGLLTVDSIEGQHGRHYYYNCTCDCGNKILKRRSYILESIDPPSCGCYRKEKVKYDIIGHTFNDLTVLSYDHEEDIPNQPGKKMYYFKCKCKCGNECIVSKRALVNGLTKSCGCRRSSMSNMSSTGFYRSYKSMIDRCYNTAMHHYKNYGGRGIKVCDRWLDPVNGFNNFYHDMYGSYQNHVEVYGERNTSIDRIDVNGNYTPENCRWATWIEQANNKRNNHLIEIGDSSYSLAEFVRLYADSRLTYDIIKHRIYEGMDPMLAATLPTSKFKPISPIHFII